ncbi:MAG TPA: pyridoxine 5'-phosphate synthase [Spirochaetota bacterium]|jgi:pyridoxine 5-phosphate synthase|nr:pyridoxine 5'-phosphate synthase [Spirochaetota bacterium]OPZ37245.1 MAG: Pyridoxine 5'-phosphate synthase [Spirochaetes bacterium ADurb.BinA120]HNU90854.1 pyridoxine 5'-phosphate synthase [Spirochaetota bacterium]HPI14950.1 pyridoxine 5'-phosphate synthase [Spirochaetota bacterium]HPO44336.1 pyridoxine 5'-phosphate synthase [Spirochaetota bacterium]
MQKTVLCVNIDHVATLRQARGGIEPDPIEAALVCEDNGAAGITVHLREDRRHIQDMDVAGLRDVVRGKLNLEMALSDDIISVARRVVPNQITLVPEKRQELTTEGGLDVAANKARIIEVARMFHDIGVLVSLFVEPDPRIVELSRETGADFIELHTGTYCGARGEAEVQKELDRIYRAAHHAKAIGIRINAGHGLSYRNLPPILETPGLEELNIGHSIISRAVFLGLARAVREIADIIATARPR